MTRPAVFAAVTRAFQARVRAWMLRRQGADALPVTLERRRLYILPTRAGLVFAALLFLMLLAGLNYGNSLALFLTFLLTGFALVSMQQCHRNLLGTTLVAAHAPPVFAGSTASLRLTLGNTAAQPRLQLEAAVAGQPPVLADLAASGEQELTLPLPAGTRGLGPLERGRRATAQPFGLVRSWSWVHAPLQLLVYPRPHGSLPMPLAPQDRPGTRPRDGSGADEWLTLRPFREGDSPRQVDWKAYAREAPLLVNEYSPPGADTRLFEFARLSTPDIEVRISQLARWVVDAEARGDRYALVLPQLRIAADRGPLQRHRCLAALAVLGQDHG
ncbi:MAG: DUF58 domain-containing protein [Steroidobacteraceae bacterium]